MALINKSMALFFFLNIGVFGYFNYHSEANYTV